MCQSEVAELCQKILEEYEAMKRGRRLDRANEGGGASPIERRNT